MNIQHDEQEQAGKFFIEEGSKTVAWMTYTVKSGNMVIEHTFVDESLRGKDVGARLVGEGVKIARQKNMKIVPVCTYAKKLLERSKEYDDVLADH
ncbi:MAG TPA: GNAT family N-acetyltransferase [Segetibacter sp.]